MPHRWLKRRPELTVLQLKIPKKWEPILRDLFANPRDFHQWLRGKIEAELVEPFQRRVLKDESANRLNERWRQGLRAEEARLAEEQFWKRPRGLVWTFTSTGYVGCSDVEDGEAGFIDEHGIWHPRSRHAAEEVAIGLRRYLQLRGPDTLEKLGPRYQRFSSRYHAGV